MGASGADPGGNEDAGESYVVFNPVIPGDLDGDGFVSIVDFLQLLATWGPCPGACPPYCTGDLDQSCSVSINDLLLLLSNWS